MERNEFNNNERIEESENTTIIEVNEMKEEKKESDKKTKESYGGIGTIVGRIFKFICKIISKGNGNFFEIRKENEKPIRIPLTVSILLLIFLFAPTMILLVVGLFCGYKYSLSGSSTNYDCINNVFEKASDSAGNVKNDFKEGYEK